MGELIIVSLLAGGMLELIRYNGGLAGVSALSIIGHLYYPFALGFMAVLSILLGFPRLRGEITH